MLGAPTQKPEAALQLTIPGGLLVKGLRYESCGIGDATG
jgi:hypothetical protein